MTLFVFDALVRHQLYIEGLKAGRTVELNATLRRINEDVRKTLAMSDYEDLGRMTREQLRGFVKSLREVMRRNFNPYIADLTKWLEAYMRVDRETFQAIYGNFTANPVEPPSDARLWPLIVNAPMGANGVLMLAFLAQSAVSAVVRVERLATQGYANNWTKTQLQQAIVGTKAAQFRDGELNRIFKASNAVNNTVIQHIAAQANLNVAKLLFPEYEWVSILDDHTTKICRTRDGHRWRYGQGPIPPAHVGCRSTFMPVIGGQPQPASTFGAWVRSQPDEVRSDLFGDRSPTSFDGVSPLTLDQFKAKRSFILTP